jgi:hypothetical protein
MVPNSVEGVFLTAEELEMHQKIIKILDDFPEMKFSKNGKEAVPDCHMFTRALAVIFPSLTVKDGWFDKRTEHSWLVTSTRNSDVPDGNIIDPCPVEQTLGPMLVWNGWDSPWRPFYMEAVVQVVETEEFLHNLEYVKRMVKKKAEILKIISAPDD